MDLKTYCPEKLVDAEEAIAKVKTGSRILVGTGCGEPQHLIHAMVKNPKIQDAMVYQMLSHTLSQYVDDADFLRRFALKLFFISGSMRRAAFEGKIDYIPSYLSQIPKLFASRRIGLDVALVQVSPPDRFGFCSLGVSVDITKAGMEAAPLVIAQVNPQVPFTWGDSIVHLDEIDYIVEHEEPLVEVIPSVKDAGVASRIGYYVSQLVEDGATIQIGFGSLPGAILPYLKGKKDLVSTPS
jgi:acyl-CoA hydrolase